MQGVRRKLLQRTAKAGGLLYVAEMHGGSVHHKMDHLVCFLPGAPSSKRTPCARALLTGRPPGIQCITTLVCGRAVDRLSSPQVSYSDGM